MTYEEKIIWKIYPEYPFIEANQFGEVRMRDRVVTRSDGKKQFVKGHILKQEDNGHGYMQVKFSVNNKTIHLYVHRIVATCFILNPNNYPEVNHKDNNPKNNAISNLEWCTKQYNNDYKKNFGTSPVKVSGRSVIAVNLETLEVFWFESQREAGRQLGFDNSNINMVVKGHYKKTHGWWFCYADGTAIKKTRSKFGDKIADKVKELMKRD